MILFYKGSDQLFYVIEHSENLAEKDFEKLSWLFGNAELIREKTLEGFFLGPRKEMVTPWSTNAVEAEKLQELNGRKFVHDWKVESLQSCSACHR